MDDEGQIHAIEAAILAFLMIASFGFTSQLSPPQKYDFSQEQLRILGDSALRTLDAMPATESMAYYHNSLLMQYIITDDMISLSDYLNEMLQQVFFTIYLTNGQTEKLLYGSENFGDDIAIATRIILAPENFELIEGDTVGIYEVKLVMWYY